MLQWSIPETTDDIPQNTILLFQTDYYFGNIHAIETHVGKLVNGVIYDTYEKVDIATPDKVHRYIELNQVLEAISVCGTK